MGGVSHVFDASESLKIGEKIVNFSDIKFTFVKDSVLYTYNIYVLWIFSDYIRMQRTVVVFCENKVTKCRLNSNSSNNVCGRRPDLQVPARAHSSKLFITQWGAGWGVGAALLKIFEDFQLFTASAK